MQACQCVCVIFSAVVCQIVCWDIDLDLEIGWDIDLENGFFQKT